MKHIVIAVIATLCAGLSVRAGTPQPCAVVHGLLKDAYGFPYAEACTLSLRKSGAECDRYEISGILDGGGNYRVELDMDSGGTPYAPYAVHPGDKIEIAVSAGGVSQPLMPTNTLSVGAAGSLTRMDLCTGTDLDHDGLPDEWEQQLVAQSGGALAGIQDVNPGDDFDGDGLTNLEEFHSGTFAFLSTDLFKIDRLESISANRMRLRFLTSESITYRLVATQSLSPTSWGQIPFAVQEDGAPGYRELVGDGAFQVIYIDLSDSNIFIRLAVTTDPQP
ncbi:MAG: hypothetical protein HN919_06810 [Verrucomicrobia bacterium]|jgi:hypothetical protein|nr:hypothetical protein [Verrucomicrobiota bacterium]MBT7065994.1 hypothetical protein [Verrucomicrobiota bacterium]MBT7699329.1 hypothetical protein [Verrucomicrobiota bacterium]